MHRIALSLVAAGTLSGCGTADRHAPSPPPTAPQPARAPAPVAAGTLSHIEDTREARQRLAFVNLKRLRATEL
ncbi:MAG TPA: hypothetical protein VF533_00710, partial [Solirubrobacteraceae bacterium]